MHKLQFLKSKLFFPHEEKYLAVFYILNTSYLFLSVVSTQENTGIKINFREAYEIISSKMSLIHYQPRTSLFLSLFKSYMDDAY